MFVGEEKTTAGEAPTTLRVKIISVRPHDSKAFTQGLVFHGGSVYESTGLKGQSSLSQVDPATGKVLRRHSLPAQLFGEGLAKVNDQLIQLTWKNGLALIYDIKTFEQTGQFHYQGEGWGLAYDGQHLIMSDGSDILTLRDPKTFEPKKRIRVLLSGEPVHRLNELEHANNYLYANVWGSDKILQIDLKSGTVQALIHAESLLTPGERRKTDVLNGICYDPTKGTFLLTGKLWPKMFEVQFVP